MGEKPSFITIQVLASVLEQINSVIQRNVSKPENVVPGNIPIFSKTDPGRIDDSGKNIKDVMSSGGGGATGSSATMELGVVSHVLGKYPTCTLYHTRYACGVGNAGEGPAGGDSLRQIPIEVEHLGLDEIRVFSTVDYMDYTGIAPISRNIIAFFNENDSTDLESLVLTLN